MSDKKEMSAIDAIYQILNEIKEIKQQISIIDSNIKILNNRINKIPQHTPPPARQIKATPNPNLAPTTPVTSNENLVKIFSSVTTASKKPIKDVYITVFNPKGEVVKKRVTDSEGYWEARIPPGQYVVEINPQHLNKKFNPININVELDETMHEFEVRNNG